MYDQAERSLLVLIPLDEQICGEAYLLAFFVASLHLLSYILHRFDH